MPISYDLGTATGKVVIDYDPKGATTATSGINAIGASAATTAKAAENLGSTLGATQRSLNLVGNSALAAGAVVAGGFAYAINAATDFQHEMSAIQSVSGATAGQMDLINAAALRIGKDTVFSASQAASAMEELLKQGLSVTQVLNGAADATVALAAAGGIDIPQAATIAANALNQFKLSAQELPKVADLIAGAANASATDVNGVGEALSFVGPVAHAAGLSITETAEAISVLANNGIDGMKAGTGLRAILSQLQPSSDKAANAMKQLGLITKDGTNAFYNQDGTLKSLSDIIGTLRNAFSGLTEEQKISYGTVIYGRDSLAAINAVAATSSDEFNKLAKAIEGTSAATVAATRMNNLAGQTEQLKGSIETLGIVIGEQLIPYLLKAVTGITNFFNALLELSPAQRDILVGVVGLGGAMLLLVGIGSKVTASMLIFRQALLDATGAVALFKTTEGGMSAIAIAAAAAQNLLNGALERFPLVLLITAIAGLIALYIQFIKKNKEAQEAFAPLIKMFQDAVKQITPVGASLSKLFASIGASVTKQLVPFFEELTQVLAGVLIPMFKATIPVVQAIYQLLGVLLPPVLQVVGVAFKLLTDVLVILLQILTPIINLIVDILVPILNVLAFIIGMVAKEWQLAGEVFQKVFGPIIALVQRVGAKFQELYQTYVQPYVTKIQNKIGAFVSWVKTAFGDELAKVINKVRDVFTDLGEKLAPIWDKIKAKMAPFVAWFKSAMKAGLEEELNIALKLFEDFLTGASIIWDRLKAVIGPFVEWFETQAMPRIRTAITITKALIQDFHDVVAPLWGKIKDAMAPMIAAFGDFKDKAQDGVGKVRDVISDLRDKFDELKARVKPYIDEFITAFETFKAKAAPYVSQVKDELEKLRAKFGELKDALAPVIADFQQKWASLKTSLEPIITAIKQLFTDLFGPLPKQTSDAATGGNAGLDPLTGTAPTQGGGKLAAFLDIVTKVFNGIIIAIEIFVGIISAIVTIVSAVVDGVIGAINFLKAAFDNVTSAISGAWNNAVNAISTAITTIGSVAGTVKDKIVGAFAGAASWLSDIGGKIIQGLKDGINGALGGLKSLLKTVTNLIPSWKGPAAVDKILLKPNGGMIMQGLMQGMKDELPNLQKTLGSITTSIPTSVSQSINANYPDNGSGSSAGGLTIQQLTITNPVPEKVSVTLPNVIRDLSTVYG